MCHVVLVLFDLHRVMLRQGQKQPQRFVLDLGFFIGIIALKGAHHTLKYGCHGGIFDLFAITDLSDRNTVLTAKLRIHDQTVVFHLGIALHHMQPLGVYYVNVPCLYVGHR